MAAAGQSATVSPFVSYIPSAATNPLAGFALTFGGTTGLALRSGAEMSLSTPRPDSANMGGYRPWGADVDAMLYLGGLGSAAMVNRGLTPYVFAGLGLTGRDSSGKNIVDHGWSYGAGANLPLGPYADIFGEMRWRMSQYVLPTSNGAPDSKSAMRFGLSFHVGGGGSGMSPGYPRRGRHRAQDDVEYVTAVPAEPQVVVVQPAEPQVIVVEQEPAPQQVVIVEPEPTYEPVPTQTTVTTSTRSTQSASSRRVLGSRSRTSTTQQTTVTTAPARSRPSSRVVVGRSTARSRTTVQQSRTQSSTPTATRRTTAPPRSTTTVPSSTSTRRVQTSTPARTQTAAPARTRATAKSTPARKRQNESERPRDERQD